MINYKVLNQIVQNSHYGMFPLLGDVKFSGNMLNEEIIIDGPDLFTGGYTIRRHTIGSVKRAVAHEHLSTSRKFELIVDRIICNDPATIIIFKSGCKSIVKCAKNEVYDREKGICFALLKYFYGADYYKKIKKICRGDIKDNPFGIRKVYFNDPLTVMIFENGSKFFAKRKKVNWPEMEYSASKLYVDSNDPEFVVALLICKKIFGKKFYEEVLKPICIKNIKDTIDILQLIQNSIHAHNKKKEEYFSTVLKHGVCFSTKKEFMEENDE